MNNGAIPKTKTARSRASVIQQRESAEEEETQRQFREFERWYLAKKEYQRIKSGGEPPKDFLRPLAGQPAKKCSDRYPPNSYRGKIFRELQEDQRRYIAEQKQRKDEESREKYTREEKEKAREEARRMMEERKERLDHGWGTARARERLAEKADLDRDEEEIVQAKAQAYKQAYKKGLIRKEICQENAAREARISTRVERMKPQLQIEAQEERKRERKREKEEEEEVRRRDAAEKESRQRKEREERQERERQQAQRTCAPTPPPTAHIQESSARSREGDLDELGRHYKLHKAAAAKQHEEKMLLRGIWRPRNIRQFTRLYELQNGELPEDEDVLYVKWLRYREDNREEDSTDE